MSEADEFQLFLNQSDKEFINKQNLGGRMEPTYNKVQYSEFTPDRVGQWVLRGDTIQEVIDMKKDLMDKLSVGKPMVTTPQPVVVPVVTPAVTPAPAFVPQPPNVPVKQYVDLTPDQIIAKYELTDMVALQVKTPCSKCGGQQIFNPKSGKAFCKAKCWLK